MFDKAFGEAGRKVLLEECLTGEEASFWSLPMDERVLPLPTSQTTKPYMIMIRDPIPGGWGPISGAGSRPSLFQEAMNRVMIPTFGPCLMKAGHTGGALCRVDDQ